MSTTVLTMISHNAALVFDSTLAVKQMINAPLFENIIYLGALLGFLGILWKYLEGDNDAFGKGFKSYLLGFLVFVVAIKGEMDMAIYEPVSGEIYVVEDAPLMLVLLGGTTSILGSGFYVVYNTFFKSPSGTDVLSSAGVGRGLAVLQGIQGSRWTKNSNNPQGYNGLTELEYSMRNYMKECYGSSTVQDQTGQKAFTVFYDSLPFGKPDVVWERVFTTYVGMVRIRINGEKFTTCRQAYDEIKKEIEKPEFDEAMVNDLAEHLTKQIAAVSLPGTGVARHPQTNEAVNTKVLNRLKKDAENIIKELFGDGSPKTIASIVFLDRLNTMLLDTYRIMPEYIQQAPEGRLGSAWNDARRQSDISMAAQGDWFSRNAKPLTMLLEILVIVFIPIFTFSMFMGQQGWKGIKGSVGVLVWLQTWPVVYVIINHITTHTVSSVFSDLFKNNNNIGMLDLYMLFDQARHSYAISQSMLGMTPMITGVLLSGSMMMLSRLSGDLSSNENVNEQRIHRDTEGTTPLYDATAAGNIYMNTDGSVGSLHGTDRNKHLRANEAADAAITNTTAQETAITQALQNSLKSQLINAIASGDAAAYNKAYSSLESLAGRDAFSMVSEHALQDSNTRTQLYNESAKIAGSLGVKGDSKKFANVALEAAGEKGKKGAVDALVSAGMERSVASQYTEMMSESNAFKEAATKALEATESSSFKVDSIEAKTFMSSQQSSDAEEYSKNLSKLDSLKEAKSKAISARTGLSADQYHGTHEIAEKTQDLFDGLKKLNSVKHFDKEGKELEEGSEDLKKLRAAVMMAYAAEKTGLSEEQTADLVSIFANNGYGDQLAMYDSNGIDMNWAHSNGTAEGYALWDRFSSVRSNKGDGIAHLAMASNLMNTHHQVKPVAPPSGIDFDLTKIDKAAKLSHNLQNPEDHARELRELNKSNVLDELFKTAGLQSSTDRKLIEGKDGREAKDNGQNIWSDFSGIAKYVEPSKYRGAYDGGENTPNAQNDIAKHNNFDDAIKKAVIAYGHLGEYFKENEGLHSDAKMRESAIMSLTKLLRIDEQGQFNNELEQALGDEKALEELFSKYEQILQSKGLVTDVDKIVSMSNRIKGEEMQNVKMSERVQDIGTLIANLFREPQEGVSEQAREEYRQLLDMTRKYSHSDSGKFSISDTQAIDNYASNIAAMPRSADGSINAISLLAAELSAVAPYAASMGQYGDFQGMIRDLEASISDPQGFGSMLTQKILSLAVSDGPQGLSMNTDEIVKFASERLGEGVYEQILAELPKELIAKMEAEKEARLASFKKDWDRHTGQK